MTRFARHGFLDGSFELLDFPLDPLFPANEHGTLLLEHLYSLGSVIACVGVGKREMNVEAEVEGYGRC